MDSFEKILLRLKEGVGLGQDKDIAELLGMSSRAFTARKTRGSFPEDKLLALSALRPDLKLDTAYILTGHRVNGLGNAVLKVNQYANRLMAVSGLPRANEIAQPEPTYESRASRLVKNFNSLSEEQKVAVETTISAFLKST